jgi:hypothetical protein
MVTVNYYIEDLATGLVVMNSGEMVAYTPEADSKVFGSHQHALEYIDLLPAGEYRIFSRIVKS